LSPGVLKMSSPHNVTAFSMLIQRGQNPEVIINKDVYSQDQTVTFGRIVHYDPFTGNALVELNRLYTREELEAKEIHRTNHVLVN